MKELILDLFKLNKKRTKRKIAFYSVFSLCFFLFMELFFKKDYDNYIYTIYNHRSYSLIFLVASIYLVIYQIYFFDKTQNESDFLNNVSNIISYDSSKNEMLFKLELIYSGIGYGFGIIVGSLSILSLYILELMKYGIKIKILIYPYFVTLVLIFIVSTLYLLKKNYKKIKRENDRDDYSFFSFGVLFLVFLYLFISFSNIIYIIFMVLLNIITISFIYKLIIFLIKTFLSEKINSFFIISFLEKRDIKKYLVMFLLLFLVITFSNQYYKIYQNNIKYINYDYIVETDDINKTLEGILLNENYIYSIETDEKIGYYKNNLIVINETETKKISMFYNFEYEDTLDYYPTNMIVLPVKFKETLNKNVGDTIEIEFKDEKKIYTIYGFIKNDDSINCYAELNENKNNGKILIKNVNNSSYENIKNTIYGTVKTKDTLNKKMNLAYNIRFLIFYSSMIFLLVLILIFMITERKKYLRMSRNKIVKFENSHIRKSLIYKNIYRTNFIELFVTYLFFVFYSFIIIRYNFDLLNSVFIGILSNFNYIDFIFYNIEIFALSIVIFTLTMVIKNSD